MFIKHIIQQFILSCLIVVFLTVQSGVIFAADKTAGNLAITGQITNGVEPKVNVNGETAVNGRSVFSSSVIETFENSGAIINLGKSGKIKAAENTKFTISFEAKNVSCNLTVGSLMIIDSDRSVEVKLPDGQTIQLVAGETVTAPQSGLPTKSAAPPTGSNGGGAVWLPWALIVGGAAAALVIATATGGNDIQLSGSTIVVSPTR